MFLAVHFEGVILTGFDLFQAQHGTQQDLCGDLGQGKTLKVVFLRISVVKNLLGYVKHCKQTVMFNVTPQHITA